MTISHLCVNYGAPLYQALFLALDKYGIEQVVFYPRNRNHVISDQKVPYNVNSPLILDLSTKVSLRWKRKVMQKGYCPVFQKDKPDLIHAHTLFSDGSLANHFYKKHGIPFIVAIRSTDFDYFLKYKPWLKSYGQQIAENAMHIVFISPSLKKKFEQVFGDELLSKSTVIPNGINQNFLSSGAISKKSFHEPLELLYVGNFRRLKNVPSLIKLVADYPAKLTIVGKGGEDEQSVLRLIQNSKNCTYLGQINEIPRLIEIYKNSDVFIMTSKSETFGLVYIEAMSQGLPLIFSKNAGIDGFFESGSVGYGVNPGSINEMKAGLEKVISNYHQISKNCIKQSKQFNWTHIAEKYHEIYRDLG